MYGTAKMPLKMMPRQQLKCFLRRRCCYLFLSIFVIIAIVNRRALKDMACLDEESIGILSKLCKDYHSEHVAGNLCSQLCDVHSISFQACINYRGGKNVFRMTWKDDVIILKTKKANISHYYLPIENTLLKEFVQMVADSVVFNMGVEKEMMSPTKIFQKMWMDDTSQYVIRRNTDEGTETFWKHGAMNSLWSLIQQDEYLLYKFYDHLPFFPKLYGTCGHFYAVEYMPPGELLSPSVVEIMRVLHLTWKNRASVALKLIELMQGFDSSFPQVLHMCDMKGENFGISKSGAVAATDVDMLVPDKRLISDLSYPNCTKHDDCSFFDCHGWCNMDTRRCTGIRTNNNLQLLCEKIFRRHMSNVFTGLLHSPPSSILELDTVLSKCAVPSHPVKPLPGCHRVSGALHCPPTSDRKPIRYKADKKYYDILKKLLEKSLL